MIDKVMTWESENVLENCDQVYSNTRVPTQVNTSQHESTRVQNRS